MLNVNNILDVAIKEDASDIHLLLGLKPVIRVARELKKIEEEPVLGEEELYEIYDYFVRGNIEKDEMYKETKKLCDSMSKTFSERLEEAKKINTSLLILGNCIKALSKGEKILILKLNLGITQ